MSNFMKMRPVGAVSIYADVQTGGKKLIVAFRIFANAPKMTAHGIQQSSRKMPLIKKKE
jgi:hypothetical protein